LIPLERTDREAIIIRGEHYKRMDENPNIIGIQTTVNQNKKRKTIRVLEKIE